MTEFVFSNDFEKVNAGVRSNWEAGRTAAKNVGKKLNELVALVHKEEPTWVINRIAQQIWVANEDLEGFSKQTIYRNISDENKALLDKRFQGNAKKNKNNVIEESVITREPNVLEQSSTFSNKEIATKLYPGKSDEELDEMLKDLPEPTAEEEGGQTYNGYDQTVIDKYENRIQKLQKENTELRMQKIGTLGNKFDFEYDYEMPSGDIIPFVVTVFPDKKDGYIRLNKAKIEENEKKEANKKK